MTETDQASETAYNLNTSHTTDNVKHNFRACLSAMSIYLCGACARRLLLFSGEIHMRRDIWLVRLEVPTPGAVKTSVF
jgi:hypothetical protein